MPPFSSSGDEIDVIVSAIGDARSLESGTLLMTPLKGADGAIYAVAQGPLTVGGFQVDSAPHARIRRNTPTTGRIPDGATVERAVPSKFVHQDQISLALDEADFTTAGRIVAAINTALGAELAKAPSPGKVLVQLPPEAQASPVSFLAKIEALDVVADVKARVVVNERTGTVVVGGNVSLSPAAVAHGNLNVSIRTNFGVSQPGPFSGGQTVVAPNVQAEIDEGEHKLHAIPKTATVDELVEALNALGASPRDLIAILQALKSSGSLRGELEVM
jgi:flagellar P-ring protein precursor FlgI